MDYLSYLYTPQQMSGAASFQHSCRIGNWSEDMELKQARLKDFVAKKETGSLAVSKMQARAPPEHPIRAPVPPSPGERALRRDALECDARWSLGGGCHVSHNDAERPPAQAKFAHHLQPVPITSKKDGALAFGDNVMVWNIHAESFLSTVRPPTPSSPGPGAARAEGRRSSRRRATLAELLRARLRPPNRQSSVAPLPGARASA